MSAGCPDCQEYVARRMDALAPAIARVAIERGVDAMALSSRYMQGVHERHLAGLSLATPFDDPEVTRRNLRRIAGRYAALMSIVSEGEAS